MCRCELAFDLLCATCPCGREQQRATPRISGSELTSRCTLPCAGLSESFTTAAAVVVQCGTIAIKTFAIATDADVPASAAAVAAATSRPLPLEVLVHWRSSSRW